MEAMEREEALEEEEAGAKTALEGDVIREKEYEQKETAAKLEGYLDGEIEDLFDAGHMQG
jgi:hypothetical protein